MTESTVLYRQVHPSFVQDGRVTSQAFRPTLKDDGDLSHYDGDQIKAEDSWEHYTSTLKMDSCGVLGVLFSEYQSFALTPIADPEEFAEHVIVGFAPEIGRKGLERLSKAICKIAVNRGWQYVPAPDA